MVMNKPLFIHLGNSISLILSGGTQYPNRPPSVATMSSTTTTMMSSLPETERKLLIYKLA